MRLFDWPLGTASRPTILLLRSRLVREDEVPAVWATGWITRFDALSWGGLRQEPAERLGKPDLEASLLCPSCKDNGALQIRVRGPTPIAERTAKFVEFTLGGIGVCDP